MNLSPLNTRLLSGTVTNSYRRQWHSTIREGWAAHLTEAQCCYSHAIALGWISCLAWMINKHINLKTSLKNSLVFARWVSCVKRRFRCLTFTWVWINRSQRNEKTSVNALQECVPFICVLFLIVWSRNVTFPAQNPLK